MRYLLCTVLVLLTPCAVQKTVIACFREEKTPTKQHTQTKTNKYQPKNYYSVWEGYEVTPQEKTVSSLLKTHCCAAIDERKHDIRVPNNGKEGYSSWVKCLKTLPVQCMWTKRQPLWRVLERIRELTSPRGWKSLSPHGGTVCSWGWERGRAVVMVQRAGAVSAYCPPSATTKEDVQWN